MSAEALYVHIPFCTSKCHYCAFSVVTNQEQQEAYVEELLREAKARLIDSPLDTLYIGGGTPSLLRKDLLEKLLMGLPKATEVTVECNPEQVTPSFLRFLQSLGVTRISIGVQTLSEAVLQRMNRQHTIKQALDALEALAASTLTWNADLILGLPEAESARDLETLLTFEPHHLSAYFLSVEPGTVLSAMKLPPENDAVVETYQHVCNRLATAGFEHVEISNWARPGHACRHNLHYWHADDYTGLGLAASSLEQGTIWTNTRNLKLYLQGKWRTEAPTILDRHDLLGLLLTSGTRLAEGLAWTKIAPHTTPKELEQLHLVAQDLQKMGLLQKNEERIILTEKAYPVHNAILSKLIGLE